MKKINLEKKIKLIVEVPEDLYNIVKGFKHEEEISLQAIADGVPYEERPKAEWKLSTYDEGFLGTYKRAHWVCSNCCRNPTVGLDWAQTRSELYSFCPWCGADMRGTKNEQD